MDIFDSLQSWEAEDLVNLLRHINDYYLQPHGFCLEEIVQEHTGGDEL
jgi:hypothetical protein